MKLLFFHFLLFAFVVIQVAAQDSGPYVYRPISVSPGDPFWFCGPGLIYEKAWTTDYRYWYCILPYYSPYYTGWWYPRYKGKDYYKYPAKGYRYYYGEKRWRRPNKENRGEKRDDLTAPDYGIIALSLYHIIVLSLLSQMIYTN